MLKKFLFVIFLSFGFMFFGAANDFDNKIFKARDFLAKKNADFEIYKNDKWGFVGKKFIDEFYDIFDERKRLENLKDFKQGAVILGVCLLLMSLFPPFIILFLIEAAVTYLMYTVKLENIENNIRRRNYSIFKNFLKNWQKYKELTPNELHSFFESFYEDLELISMSSDLSGLIEDIQDQIRKNDMKYNILFENELNKKNQRELLRKIKVARL